MRHLPRPSNERSLDAHLRQFAAVLLERFSNLRPGEIHLDACDDGVAVLRFHSQQSRFVPLEQFGSNRLFKRRRVARRPGTSDRFSDLSGCAVDFVDESTMEGLSNVTLKCA